MKPSQKKKFVRNLCIVAGCGLIVGALVVLIFSLSSRSLYVSRCEEYVAAIRGTIPPVQSAVPEPGRNNTMPALAVDGIDFVALLEFPAFESSLPVCNAWGSPEKYPCRFAGNVHESTLIIGVKEHLLPFVGELYVGDLITLTDMTGNRFTYRITDIRITEDADRDTLTNTDSALTIFVQKAFSSEYTVIRLDPSI